MFVPLEDVLPGGLDGNYGAHSVGGWAGKEGYTTATADIVFM